jgi:uncharacterized secreted repeat protein (TIGR03808 family)
MAAIRRRDMMLAGLGAGAATIMTAGPRPAEAATAAEQALTPVTEFGVKPDFGGDQTALLQKAIDSAAASRRLLFFPAGAYRLTRLELKPDIHLTGVHGRSVLIHEGKESFIAAPVADNMRLSGLVFDGGRRPLGANKDAAALIAAEDCRRLVIRDCEFTGSSADGLSLRRCSGTVTDCIFSDIRGTGLFSIDAKGLEIAHNHVSACGDNGIQVWRASQGEDATLVAHNRIERIRADSGGSGQNGNGVALFRAGSVIVQGNRISDCAFSAIRANAASNVQMIANSCARLGEVALYAEFGFEGAVIANNIVDKAAAGVSVTNFKDHGGRLAIVQGNLIRDLALKKDSEDPRGFGIAIEADGVVSANVIENAPHIGIAIGWGASMRDVTASANIVRNARIGIGISVVADAGYGYITNNMISGARDGAIRAMDHDTALGPDLAKSSAESYRNIAVFGNVST